MWTLLNFFFSFFINMKTFPKSHCGSAVNFSLSVLVWDCKCCRKSSTLRSAAAAACLRVANESCCHLPTFFSLFAVFRVGEVEINFNCFGVFLKKRSESRTKFFSPPHFISCSNIGLVVARSGAGWQSEVLVEMKKFLHFFDLLCSPLVCRNLLINFRMTGMVFCVQLRTRLFTTCWKIFVIS